MFIKKRFFALVAIIVIVLAVAIGLFYQPSAKEIPELFITANPFDLTQIKGFSKYRSCEGHDYRSPTLSGVMEATPRSMKHYVAVKPEFRGTVDKVSVFAPFTGEITAVKQERPGDSQVWLSPNPQARSQWQFIFFHINLDKNLKKGSAVTAGQRIGTANLTSGPDGATDNFDIALKFTRPFKSPAVEPPFNHATQNVMAEYAEYNISVDDFIIPKEERDANLCPVDDNSNNDRSDVFFPSGVAVDEYVWLTPSLKYNRNR